MDSAKVILEKLNPINKSDLTINSEMKSAFYNNYASFYELSADYDMAISMIDEAIKIDTEAKDNISRAIDYNNKSVILSNLKHYEDAYKLSKKSLLLYEPIVNSNLNIGFRVYQKKHKTNINKKLFIYF